MYTVFCIGVPLIYFSQYIVSGIWILVIVTIVGVFLSQIIIRTELIRGIWTIKDEEMIDGESNT